MLTEHEKTPPLPSTPFSHTIALMSCGGLFEDFFDTIGVSFEVLRTEQTGGWMFNYIEALQRQGVQTVLVFISARVSEVLRFRHEPTGAQVCIVPASPLHRAFRGLARLVQLQERGVIKSLDSYLVLPVRRLAAELKRNQVEAIVFQDYENPSFDVSVLLGQWLKVPVFASFQGGRYHRSRIERWFRTRSVRHCAGLIIGSQAELQRVQNCYQVPPEKLAQLFNPMDVMTWRRGDRLQARQALGLPLAAQIVISHGRISIAHKGLDRLLDAWQQVCRQRPTDDLRLLLVGSGQDAPQLRQLLDTMQLTNVIWVDDYIRDRPLLWRYLSAADVYVLASRYEGFPVAPIEAMACELPVVATEVAGIPDILPDGEASGGLIVPQGDAIALAHALGRVLDNPVWGREMGQRGRRRVEHYFSLEAFGLHMKNLLLHSRLKSETTPIRLHTDPLEINNHE